MIVDNISDYLVPLVKKLFGISDMTLFLRRKKQDFEKLFFHKKYTAEDIVRCLEEMGVERGKPIIVHSSMHNFYNYNGSADELIDKLIEYVGDNGTLCMPAFPSDKYNINNIFDVKQTPSAAGYLSEVFRKRAGVKRSLNKLHSVCALGKDADIITGDHHNSEICFDKHSPFYLIGQMGGYIVNLGMPRWYVGTGEHVCEALLYNKLSFFKDKFSNTYEFTYRDEKGIEIKHTMKTRSKVPYIRRTDTKLFDMYFDSSKFKRKRLSNIWITVFDMKYLYERLSELALEGIVIYSSPKFYK